MTRCPVFAGILLAFALNAFTPSVAVANEEEAGAKRARPADADDRAPRRGRERETPICEPTQLRRGSAHYSNMTQYEFFESMAIRANGCTVYPKVRLKA